MKTESGDSTNLDHLTPAQRRQLRHLLATKVMGWRVATNQEVGVSANGPEWYVDAYGKVVCQTHRWNPLVDPAAALGLLQVLAEDDKPSQVFIHENYTTVTIFQEEATDRHVLVYSCPGSTLPHAIVSAVMEAEGLEVGEVLGDG